MINGPSTLRGTATPAAGCPEIKRGEVECLIEDLDSTSAQLADSISSLFGKIDPILSRIPPTPVRNSDAPGRSCLLGERLEQVRLRLLADLERIREVSGRVEL